MILGRPTHGGPPVPGEFLEDAVAVRAAYRALEDGDAEALARYVDPRIEWVHSAATRLPFDGTLRGLPSVLRAAFRLDEDGNGPQVAQPIPSWSSATAFWSWDASRGVMVRNRPKRRSCTSAP